MTKTAIKIIPRDLLFFRDARPMMGSSEGSGGEWPLPSVLHSSLLSAFHKRWPDIQTWENQHHQLNAKENKKFRKGGSSSMRFGGLKTLGPFPCQQGTIFLPTPADIDSDGTVMRPIKSDSSTNNLPSPLRYLVGNSCPPSKAGIERWISLGDFQRYLAGKNQKLDLASISSTAPLYSQESRPGVEIDPRTRSNRETIFYQAQYLRLADGVSLVSWADALNSRSGESTRTNLLDELFTDQETISLILGGQGGMAGVTRMKKPFSIFSLQSGWDNGLRVKWVLLSPACFNAGWLPGWINPPRGEKNHHQNYEPGRVMLPAVQTPREEGERRTQWRNRARGKEPVEARLVAARIPREIVYSGWKLQVQENDMIKALREGEHAGFGPKPTRLLIPAGSIYYFDCADKSSAEQLVKSLHLQVKSDLWGEQGFGFGVCGSWEFNNFA